MLTNHLTRKFSQLILLIMSLIILFSGCSLGNTPGTSADEKSGILSGVEPIFSHESGIYSDKITLTLTLPEGVPEGTVIRYSRGDETPTAESPVYRSGITLLGVSSYVTINAACFDSSGTRISQIVTKTFIKCDKSPEVWAIFITIDTSDLSEILASPNEKIEKPAHIIAVNRSGETVINQDAGVRLFGGSSRGLAEKSFKIIARKTGYFETTESYSGKGSFNYPLFENRLTASGELLDKYDSFILRNGGNDSMLHNSVDPLDATLLRDGVCNNFAAKVTTAVSSQLSQPAVLYINGEYYGLMDMKENLNEDYIKRIYNVSDDDVVVVKSELDTSRHCDEHNNGGECRFCDVWFFYETDDTKVAQNALNEWISLCKDAIACINASDSVYNTEFRKLSEKIDLTSFCEYMLLNLFLSNTDWPHNNVKLWKYTGAYDASNPVTDGRWRFMTRDMDMTLARYSSPDVLPELDSRAEVDTFRRCLGNYYTQYSDYYTDTEDNGLYPDSLYLQGLLAFCLRNDDFRSEFETTARRLASAECTELLSTEFESYYDAFSSSINAQINRWSDYASETRTDWETACNKIRDYIAARPQYFLEDLELLLSFFG